MRYKPGKEYIVPNTLSRLITSSEAANSLADNYSKLDYLFTALFIKINDAFHNRLIKGYKEDPI